MASMAPVRLDPKLTVAQKPERAHADAETIAMLRLAFMIADVLSQGPDASLFFSHGHFELFVETRKQLFVVRFKCRQLIGS
jgi:hypothetical protein